MKLHLPTSYKTRACDATKDGGYAPTFQAVDCSSCRRTVVYRQTAPYARATAAAGLLRRERRGGDPFQHPPVEFGS